MNTILKDTWTILEKKEKKQFIFLSLFDIVISLLDILFLAILLWIIQFYIQPGQVNKLSFLPHWLGDRSSVSFIAVFFFLFGMKNMAGFLISRAGYRFNSNIAIRISRNSLLNYQQAAFEEFVNTDSSVHIRRICLQPFDFCMNILSGLQQIITQASLILITIIAITIFNVKLFVLLLLILLPPVIIVFYIIKKRVTTAKKHILASNEKSYQYLLDALKGYVESNVYDRNEFFMERFIKSRKKFSSHLFASLALQTLPSRVIEIFAVLGLFILIVIAKWSGIQDSATLITIGAFMAAAYKIIPGIVKIINITGQIKAYEFSVADLKKQTPPGEKNERPGTEAIDSIELKHIHFKYQEQPVLSDFSLSLKKGDFIGITGQSGKGKTTILNLLLGFLNPSSGNILINDRMIEAKELINYWPQISYVRQQSFLIHDTILRNITFEEDGYKKEELEFALNLSGVNQLMATYAEGLEKVISENGKNISGGQQQRIALARAVYKNAEIILLDEPFNELDEASEISMLEHFKELAAKGRMIVMITHDKRSLSYCNKIISLDEG